MFIKNYGLFWRSDEIDWYPGKGAKGAFRLLGRQGWNSGTLQLADFRHQQGIYILYGDYGPYYTGLTTKQGLGKRLKDHTSDWAAGRWNRFSWFGFQRVLKAKDEDGIRELANLAIGQMGQSETIIRDVEALLIRAMGLRNIAQTKFSAAEKWLQVEKHEVAQLIGRAGG